jgi:hypothetical protein
VEEAVDDLGAAAGAAMLLEAAGAGAGDIAFESVLVT